jgi:hypothetical protein
VTVCESDRRPSDEKREEKRSFKLNSAKNKLKKKKEKKTTTTLEDPLEMTYKSDGRQTRLTGSEIDA